MPSSEAIRAGQAFVEILANDVSFRKTLEKSARTFQAWGKTLTAAGGKLFAGGAALITPLLAATKAYASMGTELARGAAKTGISVEQLSQLKYAAQQSGVSLEGLEVGIKRMGRAISDASAGSRQAAEALGQIGLSAADLAQLSPDQQFKLIADRISHLSDAADRSAVSMKIFGRSGTELLPLMAEGADGINKMMQHADELGLTMSTRDAQAAEEFSHRLSDLWDVVKMGVFTIGGALVPVVRAVAIGFSGAVKVVRQWIGEHKGVVVLAAGIAAGLLAAAAAVTALGLAFSLIGTVLGGVLAAMGVIGTIAAAVASPLGLLAAGIAAGTAALLRFTRVGQSVGSYLGQVFAALKTQTLAAFDGIRAALAAGDWSLAAQILWSYLKLEFARGTGQVLALWAMLKTALLNTWVNLSSHITTAWSYVTEYLSNWDGVKAAAMKFITWLSNAWSNVVDFLADRWAKQKVTFDAEQAVRQQYGNRTLDNADASRLAQGEISQKRVAILGAHGNDATAAAPEIEAMIKDTQERYRRQFAGRQLSGDEINALVAREIDARVSALRQQQQSSHAASDQAYRQRQDQIDQQFQSARPDIAGAAAAARAKIEAEQQEQIDQNNAELQKAIATAIDPAKIAELKKQLAEQIGQAKDEAAAAAPQYHSPFDKDQANEGLMAMKGTAPGTFNKSALSEIFGGANSPLERIARNSDKQLAAALETNKALGKMGLSALTYR